MIKVDRPKGSAPPGLATAAAKELRANRIALQKAQKLTFTAYSTPSSKAALTQVFGRKCAFCESLLAGTQSGDIEHYRPKGKVIVENSATGARMKLPGYFWLAAKWSNLLISCADCNRPRTQSDHDNVDRVIGKSNFFPVVDEAYRALGPRGIPREEALLLNPCLDDPTDHLKFKDDGRVEPVTINGAPSQKGLATIRYCGLARMELLQMRARHQRIVMAAIRHTIAALEAGQDPGADLDDLVSLLDCKEAYVALTRSLIQVHMGPLLQSLGLTQLL